MFFTESFIDNISSSIEQISTIFLLENPEQKFITSTEIDGTPSLLRTSSEHSDIKEVWRLLEEDDISLENSKVLQTKSCHNSEVSKDKEYQYEAAVTDSELRVVGQPYLEKVPRNELIKGERLGRPQSQKQRQQQPRFVSKNNQRKIRNYNDKK